MALKDIIDQQVANAFTNILAPGGLTEQVTFRFFVSEGTYDVETDTSAPVWDDVTGLQVVVAKPGFDDVKGGPVIFTDAKLIIPGSFITKDPEVDTDKVLRMINGVEEEWDIRKTIGVPGRGVFIIFIYRT